MSRVRITACRDFPGHAHRVAREALCSACVVEVVRVGDVTRTACERCGGTRLVQKMSGPAPCPRPEDFADNNPATDPLLGML